MPLVGIIEEARVESWSVPEDDWRELKAEYRSKKLTMSCGQAGVPVTRGETQFFRHKPGSDCQLHEGGAETKEHLQAKAIIAEAARAHGWTATVEYPAPGRSWIADVLVEKNGRRIAVEVQWSGQSEAEFERRQTRYTDAGIECIWLVGPSSASNAQHVPHHRILGKADALFTELPLSATDRKLTSLPIQEGLSHIFSGAFVERAEAIATSLEICTWMSKCWNPKCSNWLSLWHLGGVDFETRCGGTSRLYAVYESWAATRAEEWLQEIVTPQLAASDLAVPAYYETRFSSIAKVYYLAQICPHCRVVQGDGHLDSERWRAKRYSIPVRTRFPFPKLVTDKNHLCSDIGNGRCEQAEPPRLPTPSSRQWLGVAESEEIVAPLPRRKGKFGAN